MTDERENKAPQHATGDVRNISFGSAFNVIQMRDLQGGSIYINSHVVVHHESRERDPVDSSFQPLNVLVVDDDRDALDTMVRLLQGDSRIGRVGAATDAAMALRYIQTEAHQDHPTLDAWFLDVSMPGLSGIELAWVGAQFSPAPVTVFVTAHEEHAVDAFNLDAADYLVKPISTSRLSRAIDRLCRRNRDSRDLSHPGNA